MPDIQAFRGLRYDLGHIGNLSDVVAPPYDVIDPPMQDALYKRHPANVVRLILNRDEPGDDAASNRYTRAAKFLKAWRRDGVLRLEPDPAVYVYHQVFSWHGQRYTRRGFMCRVRLSRFGEGNIYPHEQTHASAKADRLRLTEACHANLSQVFGLYPDPDANAQNQLDLAIATVAPVEATDQLGVVHRLWPVADISVITDLSRQLGTKPIFVADGHHRYETACDYRDQLAERHGPLPTDHPANFVLMMCVGMSDPGMIVLPTHRLLRGIPPLGSADLVAKLGECFATRVVGAGADRASSAWADIEQDDDQGTMGFFCQQDQQWVIAQLTVQGRARMAAVAAEQSAAWQGLGVAILQRLVVETLLGVHDPPRPEYVHRVDEVIDQLTSGDPEGGQFPLAVLVKPATLEHVRQISENGERMPAKSTYFYPKLLSGLVINPVASPESRF
jgi:uncharacterized protein (DUF1015 family)